jgi:hypothetical protein
MKDRLLKLQSELKSPKSLFNKFGNYNYRSAETILESVKPLLLKYNLLLTLSDDIVFIGQRYYVKSTAKLNDVESDGVIEVVGFAREEETKKGQDASQITGSASSYSRKYALNGLFDIDDVKDSDGTNTHGKTEAIANEVELITPEQVGKITRAISDEEVRKIVNYAKTKDPNVKSIADLTKEQATSIMKKRGIE